jgi:hypothetical protein
MWMATDVVHSKAEAVEARMNRVTLADLADLSEVEFDRRLKAERDALAAKYDNRPYNSPYNSFADQDRVPAPLAAVNPYGDEEPDAIHWPSLCAGLIFGLLAGILAIAIPAIVIARVMFGVWL